MMTDEEGWVPYPTVDFGREEESIVLDQTGRPFVKKKISKVGFIHEFKSKE